jgi:hypothetical protein
MLVLWIYTYRGSIQKMTFHQMPICQPCYVVKYIYAFFLIVVQWLNVKRDKDWINHFGKCHSVNHDIWSLLSFLVLWLNTKRGNKCHFANYLPNLKCCCSCSFFSMTLWLDTFKHDIRLGIKDIVKQIRRGGGNKNAMSQL